MSNSSICANKYEYTRPAHLAGTLEKSTDLDDALCYLFAGYFQHKNAKVVNIQ